MQSPRQQRNYHRFRCMSSGRQHWIWDFELIKAKWGIRRFFRSNFDPVVNNFWDLKQLGLKNRPFSLENGWFWYPKCEMWYSHNAPDDKKHPNYAFFWSWLLTAVYDTPPPGVSYLLKTKNKSNCITLIVNLCIRLLLQHQWIYHRTRYPIR